VVEVVIKSQKKLVAPTTAEIADESYIFLTPYPLGKICETNKIVGNRETSYLCSVELTNNKKPL
jgi:hypothetical protein